MDNVKIYCVVYIVCGVHYRYRCVAHTKNEARKMCCENMGVRNKQIVEIYKEEYEDF